MMMRRKKWGSLAAMLFLAAAFGAGSMLSIESLTEGWDGYFIGNSSEISKVHINKEGSVRYCLLEEYFFGKKLEI